jgi:hypothetical protein
MTRHQLEHIIRASAGNADVKDVVIIGSQSILGTYPDAPDELTESMEVFPKDAPERSIVIEGAIGELSLFHSTFGYYAHGVDETTAILPTDWRDGLVKVDTPGTMGAVGWCLEPHDLAVSKLAAGREKDLAFVGTMIRKQLVTPEVIRQRLATTPRLQGGLAELAIARLNAMG